MEQHDKQAVHEGVRATEISGFLDVFGMLRSVRAL